MKAAVVLSLFGVALAGTPCDVGSIWGPGATAPMNILSVAGNAVPSVVNVRANEGYVLSFLDTAGTAAAPGFANVWGNAGGGNVLTVLGQNAAADSQFRVACDSGNAYVPSNVAGVSDATTPAGFGNTCDGATGTLQAGTNLGTGVTTTAWVPGTFVPSDWVCRKVRAQISCTSAASNGLAANSQCTSLPAFLEVDQSVYPCVPASAPLTAAIDGGAAAAFNARGWRFNQPTNPTIDTVVAFVCSAQLFDITSGTILALALPWYSAYNTGNNDACNCGTGSTLTFDYTPFTVNPGFSPTSYTQCLSTCTAGAVPQAVTGPGSVTRQALNGRTISGCPATLTTLTDILECLRRAHCQGAINVHTDTCVISRGYNSPVGVNGAGNPGTGVACSTGAAASGVALVSCPKCDSSKSKKGLLGLLGLLGLIPLLLCLLCSSLLCCLLWFLCCIRGKKAERDVHFATFDAGAPVAAPVAVTQTVCEEVPVQYTTAVNTTHVGVPVECGLGGVPVGGVPVGGGVPVAY